MQAVDKQPAYQSLVALYLCLSADVWGPAACESSMCNARRLQDWSEVGESVLNPDRDIYGFVPDGVVHVH